MKNIKNKLNYRASRGKLNYNHCVHGITLNDYCSQCEFDILELADWSEISDTQLEQYTEAFAPTVAEILSWSVN